MTFWAFFWTSCFSYKFSKYFMKYHNFQKSVSFILMTLDIFFVENMGRKKCHYGENLYFQKVTILGPKVTFVTPLWPFGIAKVTLFFYKLTEIIDIYNYSWPFKHFFGHLVSHIIFVNILWNIIVFKILLPNTPFGKLSCFVCKFHTHDTWNIFC